MTSTMIEVKATTGTLECEVETVNNFSNDEDFNDNARKVCRCVPRKFNDSKLDINKSYSAEELIDHGLVQVNGRFIDFRSCEEYIVTFVRRNGAYEFGHYYSGSDNFNGNGKYLY
jgi:hypothetical protein